MTGQNPTTGGAQDMGMPNFDFSALQNVLNVRALAYSSIPLLFYSLHPSLPIHAEHPVLLQDPSIKQMAEQIAQDPAFAQMTAALQASVAGDEAGKSDVEDKTATDVPEGPALPTMDAEKYAQAMSNVLQNQHFMEMAEKLGQQIMSVRHLLQHSATDTCAVIRRFSSRSKEGALTSNWGMLTAQLALLVNEPFNAECLIVLQALTLECACRIRECPR